MPLGGADRAFAYAMTRAALRHLGRIDALLGGLMRKPPPPRVRDILRIGVAQLLFLRSPAHAVVHVAVEQAGEHAASKPFAALVNAVLRTCAREGQQRLEALPARVDVPPALLASWQAAYGAGQAEQIAAAHGREPPVDLQFGSEEAAARWQGEYGGALLPAGGVRLREAGEIAQLPGYEQGIWWVQDIAASLPVRLFGGGISGQPVLDLCAAPGGKTAQLCALGARVTAVDRSAARLQVLRDNLRRLGFKAEVVEADMLSWRPRTRKQPYVFLDAPCSASGTLRRNPDVAWRGGRNWRVDGGFVSKLVALQRKLLAAAAGMTAPGGVLVYSVCSLQPEEGEMQVDDFLRDHAGFRRVAVDAGELGGPAEWVSRRGDLRTLPCHLDELGGMDGFYAARLVRHDGAVTGL